ncbi:MAG: spermidine synthase [Deltaproteobacteria bacterium HGW-Deltaproteobacteria-4]|nr:MAG: spermidine synthase [Deltaproteobacteria bacterium HGW-Deltaproteobacteria-4]
MNVIRFCMIIITSLWVIFCGTTVNATAKIIHIERSIYRNIIVSDSFGTRCLRFSRQNNIEQSCISLNDPASFLFDCNKMMMGALYLRPNPRKILIVGLGGGTLPTALMRILPESEIHVVELDPAMVRVAKKYFNFQPTAKVLVAEEDGRVFVKRAIKNGAKYDLIMLDAFDDKYVPGHMLTQQFLQEVKSILMPDGVLAANTFSHFNDRYDNESVTYESVYGDFYNLKKLFQNVRIIIAKQSDLPSLWEVKENSKILEEKLRPLGIQPSWLLPFFTTDQDWDKEARVLTDQFLPKGISF